MKHGVTRRGDQIPLELMHTEFSINGLIALDMLTGESLHSIQASSLQTAASKRIYQRLHLLGWILHIVLALVTKYEFISETPLGVVGTNLVIPQSILSDGRPSHTFRNSQKPHQTPTSETCSKMHEPEWPFSMHEILESTDWWAILW